MTLRENVTAADGFILALETGIAGGSIALLKDGETVAGWTGSLEVSRAEDILDEINKMLLLNGATKKSVEMLAISKGPGSFTGLRIGLAIALGLRASLRCGIAAEPVLEALLGGDSEKDKIVCAVPFGKNQICWQYFAAGGNAKEIRVSEARQFIDELQSLDFRKMIVTKTLSEKLISLMDSESNRLENRAMREKEFVQVGDNLAALIGARAFDNGFDANRFNYGLIYPNQPQKSFTP